MRIRIARKEAKETAYWLKLIDTGEEKEIGLRALSVYKEAVELMLILSAIMRKAQS